MKPSIHYFVLTPLLIILFNGAVAGQSNPRPGASTSPCDTTCIKMLVTRAFYNDENDSIKEKYLGQVYDLSLKSKFRYGLAFGYYRDALVLKREGRHREAVEKCKQCIDALDSLRVIQNILFPLSEIRLFFSVAGSQTERLKFYSDKLAYYRQYGPKENMANCYHAIGGYYWDIADYDKAIGYYLRARNAYKSFDTLGYVNENQVIGSCYLEWGNLEKADRYLQSALKELHLLQDNSFFCYHQLGDLYLKKQDYKRALQYYYAGKPYCTKPDLTGINLVSCAVVHVQMKSTDSARLYLDRAEKIRQKEKLGIVFANGYFEIDYGFYKYYRETGNSALAIRYLEAALVKAKSAMFLPLIMKYTNELHDVMLNNGDSIQALRYLVDFHDLQDSVQKMNAEARIATFEVEQEQQQKEQEIEQLRVQKNTQRNYYLMAGVILILIVVATLSRIRYKRKRDREQLTSEFKNQLAQAETKALRAQMNPHFIFNSLNSINSFVMDQQHELASEYLIKFSKLIRLILDNSRSESISIEKELETLKLYVALEAARFDDRFKCIYRVAGNIDASSVMIPPMLLQPFVENSIWHGLMHKEGEGTITIELTMMNEELLMITIEDDGIGREKAAEMKSKSATHKSHGLKVTSQRIEMMNKLNSSGAKVTVVDLKDEQGIASGTRVELVIPV
jgi:hypothetical protein